MRPLHAIAGAILLVLLPLESSVLGSGFFAWTMYSGSSEYRIDIRVKDAAGNWRTVAPTGLAESSSEATAGILVGAEAYRRGPSLAVFRAHLGELAAYACRARRGVEADVVLHERIDETSPERDTSARAECR